MRSPESLLQVSAPLPPGAPTSPRQRLRVIVFGALLACAATAAAVPPEPRVPAAVTELRLQWSWAVFGSGIGARGLEILDLDQDGAQEIVGTSESDYWFVAREGAEIEPVWSSLPVGSDVRAFDAVVAGAQSWVVVGTATEFRVYDGVSRGLLHSFPAPSNNLQVLAAADLDGGASFEIVACDLTTLYVYELATGALVGSRPGFGCRDLDVGPFDADPQLEIALAGNASGGFVLDGVSLDPDWTDPRGFGNRVRLVDLVGDATAEIVSTIGFFEGLRAQDPDGAGTLWEDPAAEPITLVAADVDAAPGVEVVWGDWPWANVHVLAGSSGTALWTVPGPERGITRIAVGDPDGDQITELVWGAGAADSGADHLWAAGTDTHAVEATSLDLRGPLRRFTVADLDGDGVLELATAATETDSGYGPGVFLVLSFQTGELLRASGRQWPGSFGEDIQAVAAAQLDDDPALELCAVGGSYGVVGCYDSVDFVEQWRLILPERSYSIAVGELDDGGQPELLVGADQGHVYAFEGESGWLRWRTPTLPYPFQEYTRLHLADLEADGAPEVLAGFGFPYLYDGFLTTFAGGSGALLHGPFDTPVTSMLVTELDGDPGDEILLGQSDGEVLPVDPATGATGPPLATFPAGVQAFARLDVTRDGVADLVAVGGGHLRLYDGAAGTIVWTSPFLGTAAGYDESLLAGDLDGDSLAEIVVNTGFGVAVFEAPAVALFADGFESGDTSAWSATVP